MKCKVCDAEMYFCKYGMDESYVCPRTRLHPEMTVGEEIIAEIDRWEQTVEAAEKTHDYRCWHVAATRGEPIKDECTCSIIAKMDSGREFNGVTQVAKKITATSPSLIGLTGRMGTGKDAAAALLSMVSYERRAFADGVRDEVYSRFLNFHPFPAAMPSQIRDDVYASEAEDVWAKPTPSAMRRILQWFGTWRREKDPGYWVKDAMFYRPSQTVFSDVRYLNEVAAIRNAGGVIWKLTRSGVTLPAGIPGHPSEENVDLIVPDLTIPNDGTLIDLATRLRKALNGN